jgi:hypothetical protein
MLGSVIIAAARKILGDEGADRFTATDLLEWLNEGRRQVAAIRPDAVAALVDITLVAGAEQTIPATAFKLLNIPANTENSKRSITYIDTDALNAIDLNWREADSPGYVEHYTYDEDQPMGFEVYPPASAGMKVRALVAVTPTDIAANADVGFKDIYQGVLTDWVVYRAASQPSDSVSDEQRAANALSALQLVLGTKTQVDAGTKPQRK